MAPEARALDPVQDQHSHQIFIPAAEFTGHLPPALGTQGRQGTRRAGASWGPCLAEPENRGWHGGPGWPLSRELPGDLPQCQACPLATSERAATRALSAAGVPARPLTGLGPQLASRSVRPHCHAPSMWGCWLSRPPDWAASSGEAGTGLPLTRVPPAPSTVPGTRQTPTDACGPKGEQGARCASWHVGTSACRHMSTYGARRVGAHERV